MQEQNNPFGICKEQLAFP